MTNINLYGLEWEEIDREEYIKLDDSETLYVFLDSKDFKIYYKKVQSLENEQANRSPALKSKSNERDGSSPDTQSPQSAGDDASRSPKKASISGHDASCKPETLGDTINLFGYEQTNFIGYGKASKQDRLILWKDKTQYHFIKKENKFPKEFEDSEYNIFVEKNWIDICLKGHMFRFSSLRSLPLLIQAIDYWRKNHEQK